MNEEGFLFSPTTVQLGLKGEVTGWCHMEVAKAHREHVLVKQLPPVSSECSNGCTGNERFVDIAVRKWFNNHGQDVLAARIGILKSAKEIVGIDYVCENAHENLLYFVFETRQRKYPTKEMKHFVQGVLQMCSELCEHDRMQSDTMKKSGNLFGMLPEQILEEVFAKWLPWECALQLAKTSKQYYHVVSTWGGLHVESSFGVVGSVYGVPESVAEYEWKKGQEFADWLVLASGSKLCKSIGINVEMKCGSVQGYRPWAKVCKLDDVVMQRMVATVKLLSTLTKKTSVRKIGMCYCTTLFTNNHWVEFQSMLQCNPALESFTLELGEVGDDSLLGLLHFIMKRFGGLHLELILHSKRLYPTKSMSAIVAALLDSVLQKGLIQQASFCGNVFNNIQFPQSCGSLRILEVGVCFESVVEMVKMTASVHVYLRQLETLVCGFSLSESGHVSRIGGVYDAVCEAWVECIGKLPMLKHLAVRGDIAPAFPDQILEYIARLLLCNQKKLEVVDFAVGILGTGCFYSGEKVAACGLEYSMGSRGNHCKTLVCGQSMGEQLLCGYNGNVKHCNFAWFGCCAVGMHILQGDHIEITNMDRVLCDAAMTNMENNKRLPHAVVVHLHVDRVVNIFPRLVLAMGEWFQQMGQFSVHGMVQMCFEFALHRSSPKDFVLNKSEMSHLCTLSKLICDTGYAVEIILRDGVRMVECEEEWVVTGIVQSSNKKKYC
eukprot:3305406-Rhodomonas_salina.2